MWGKASANGGNVASDVATLTSIGFDGIKVDGCGPAHDIAAWVRALAAADGRPLLLENCGDNTDGQKTGPWTWSVPRPQDVSGKLLTALCEALAILHAGYESISAQQNA
eukprot:m.174352 g.174352  ORF g.174352 m.174352 type:complete len:109 (+) comp18328_c0_seq1:60-386(+)